MPVNVLLWILAALAIIWALAYWRASALGWSAALAAGLLIFGFAVDLGNTGTALLWAAFAGAACVFPVTEKEMQDRSTGLRHRAAIGLTERTDAIAIVVSEETGSISISENGSLQRNLTEKQFREKISEIFFSGQSSNETETVEKLDRETPVSSSGDRDLVSD